MMRGVFFLAAPLLAQTLTLAELERRALERNPTVAQAEQSIAAAAGLAKQAGLYPNPVVAASGEEVAAGPIIRGGEFGGGVRQRIVTAGKLGLDRRVAQQSMAITEEGARAQRQRVLNAVRRLYYQALSDQYRVEIRSRLAGLAAESVKITAELANIGQADVPDQLAAEVEAHRAALELVDAEQRRERTWKQLAAVVNDPDLRPAPLEGDLEQFPRLDGEQALAAIYEQSPELRAAEIGVRRAETALTRARKEVIPDIQLSGGMRYNRKLLEADMRPVGKEGFFDIGVELPIFNRNQGNVAAARAEVERARLEVDRTRLELKARLAEAYREYNTALLRADRLRQEMLPKAQRAYELYLGNFRQLLAAYPLVLMTQRNLFQLRDAYVDALSEVWRTAVEIDGLLLGELWR
jgi:cobalt-zinc-cadmium efflux system outer membrane protein